MDLHSNVVICLSCWSDTLTTYHSRDGVTSRLRNRGHDYTSAASYFITMCTERRACLFGDVRDRVIVPSPAGAMVDSWWQLIPGKFASVELDAMIVMPNHIHAIVHVATDPSATMAPPLGDMIRWFKIRTTFGYTVGVKEFGWPRFPGRLWQTKYYDHIIRNERGLERVRAYIEGNPGKWMEDEYNSGSTDRTT